MITERSVRTALLSTDRGFRDLVKDVLATEGEWATVALEVAVPFSSYGDEQIRVVRQLRPELIFLDLSDDPGVAIKLAEFLADAMPGQRFIATGPSLASDQLLAAMRAGVADYLPKPVMRDALVGALRRLRPALAAAPAPAEAAVKQPGKLYTFYSAKGGAGTTTAATNFAVAVHRLTEKRTLLVDLDLELGEIGLLLGVQPRFNFVDMVQNFHRMDAELLASYIERHESGVHLLSAPFQPEKAEAVTGEEIKRILNFLRRHYDYVIVDTSKSFSPATLAAFELSDLAFVVTNVDLASLRNLQRGLPLIKRMLGREDHVRLIVNRYDPDRDLPLAEVERTLGVKVFRTLANDYERVSRSISTGSPIVLSANSKFGADMRALGMEVTGVRDKTARTGGPLAGLSGSLGRLLGRPGRSNPEEVPS